MHHLAQLLEAVLLSRIIWTGKTQALGMKCLDATQPYHLRAIRLLANILVHTIVWR